MNNTDNTWAGSGNHNEDLNDNGNYYRDRLLSDNDHYIDAAGHVGSYSNPYEVDGRIMNH